MTKIICLILIGVFSASVVLAQGSSPGRTRSKSKISINKKVSGLTLAKKAWKPFWVKFKKTVKKRDKKTLKILMSPDFENRDDYLRRSNLWIELEWVLNKGNDFSEIYPHEAKGKEFKSASRKVRTGNVDAGILLTFTFNKTDGVWFFTDEGGFGT